VDFTYLKTKLALTDGNLGAHLATIEQAATSPLRKPLLPASRRPLSPSPQRAAALSPSTSPRSH